MQIILSTLKESAQNQYLRNKLIEQKSKEQIKIQFIQSNLRSFVSFSDGYNCEQL